MSYQSWSSTTLDIAVASPVTINIPADVSSITYTVSTDVGGTGTLDVTGSVNESPSVALDGGSLNPNIANIDIKNYDGNLSSITFTPSTLATATTYKVYISGNR